MVALVALSKVSRSFIESWEEIKALTAKIMFSSIAVNSTGMMVSKLTWLYMLLQLTSQYGNTVTVINNICFGIL